MSWFCCKFCNEYYHILNLKLEYKNVISYIVWIRFRMWFHALIKSVTSIVSSSNNIATCNIIIIGSYIFIISLIL